MAYFHEISSGSITRFRKSFYLYLPYSLIYFSYCVRMHIAGPHKELVLLRHVCSLVWCFLWLGNKLASQQQFKPNFVMWMLYSFTCLLRRSTYLILCLLVFNQGRNHVFIICSLQNDIQHVSFHSLTLNYVLRTDKTAVTGLSNKLEQTINFIQYSHSCVSVGLHVCLASTLSFLIFLG